MTLSSLEPQRLLAMHIVTALRSPSTSPTTVRELLALELHGSGIETLFWQSNVAWVEAVNPLSYFREAQQQLVTIA